MPIQINLTKQIELAKLWRDAEYWLACARGKGFYANPLALTHATEMAHSRVDLYFAAIEELLKEEN